LSDVDSIVDQVHPAVSGLNIILSDTIRVTFDREMDEARLGDNLFIAGPDNDTHTGPDHRIWIDFPSIGDEEEILQSPGYHGLVQGAFTYSRHDLSSETVVSGIDVVGSGHLYRTRTTFTPTNRLAPNTRYYVYLSGDEAAGDGLDTGISGRTVFDPIAAPGNTGIVDPVFEGGFSWGTNDTYNIEIMSTGTTDTATFRYWTTLFPTKSTSISVKRSGVLLRNGVTIKFPPGTWTVGDTWTVVAKKRDTFTGNLIWTFLTGSGSIQEVPAAASTSVLGDAIPAAVAVSTGLSVSSTLPADKASHQTIPDAPYVISATFNKAIDPTTVVSGVTATVTASPVDGDEVTHPADGVLIAEPSVSGATLSITVASGQLNNNNMVDVVIDESIRGVDGSQMAAEYSWWFTTTYSPYYCTLQKVRLEVGAYIPAVIDDTINMSIHQASIDADALTWNTSASSSFYTWVRGKWACCKAQEVVLLNAMQSQDKLKSKSLGDLSVEYNIGDNDALDRALACMDRWEAQLQTGGEKTKSQNPTMVAKGELDVDRPPIGRRWGYMNGYRVPAANTRHSGPYSRRHRSTYSRPHKGKNRYDR